MLGVIGGALILLGFALLVLVDAPRRAMAQLAILNPAVRRRARPGGTTEGSGVTNRHVLQTGVRMAKRSGRWFLGR
jgi:hypothetical protein